MKLSTLSPHPSGAQHRILVKKLSPIGSIAPWEKYFYQDGTSSTTKSFTNMLKGFRFLLYGKIGGWNLSFWLLRYSGIFIFFGYLGSSPPGRGIDIVAKSDDFSKNQKCVILKTWKTKSGYCSKSNLEYARTLVLKGESRREQERGGESRREKEREGDRPQKGSSNSPWCQDSSNPIAIWNTTIHAKWHGARDSTHQFL